jgi:SNF2 family DNA or RNA helicase
LCFNHPEWLPLLFLLQSFLFLQGLNGILADEMGLGKTVQAMAFLSHLAEVSEFML